jgi:Ran GTPase-activating protein (RanGAP) involved in mRNA processing and transport
MLNLQSNDLRDEGVQILIPSLQNLFKLDNLNLTDNDISSVSANLLVGYLNTVKIDGFDFYLGHNQLGDKGGEVFLSLSKYAKPCSIYLERNNISDEIANKLQQLSHVKWSINITPGPRYNPSLKFYSTLNIKVDSYETLSKEDILLNDE